MNSPFQDALDNIIKVALEVAPNVEQRLEYVMARDRDDRVREACSEARDALEVTAMKLFPNAEDMSARWNHGNHQLVTTVDFIVDDLKFCLRTVCWPLSTSKNTKVYALEMKWLDSYKGHEPPASIESSCDVYTMKVFDNAKREVYGQLPKLLKDLKYSAERNAIGHEQALADFRDNDDVGNLTAADRRQAHVVQYMMRHRALTKFMKRNSINGV